MTYFRGSAETVCLLRALETVTPAHHRRSALEGRPADRRQLAQIVGGVLRVTRVENESSLCNPAAVVTLHYYFFFATFAPPNFFAKDESPSRTTLTPGSLRLHSCSPVGAHVIFYFFSFWHGNASVSQNFLFRSNFFFFFFGFRCQAAMTVLDF